MQALLQDVDMSLMYHKPRAQPVPRELEALPVEEQEEELNFEEYVDDTHRKSPAALFGSQGIGAVVVPHQLQSAVTSIIEGAHSTRRSSIV